MRVLVLADTHIRPGRNRRLPDQVYAELTAADAVLHAGDVVTHDLLDELSGFAPVHAVLGNNDHELLGVLPEVLEIHLEGVAVGLVHETGVTKGRPARVKRRFPDAAIVVYGHSHQPDDSEGIDGQRLFNPGSPTERRNAPHRSYGVLELRSGEIAAHTIVSLAR